MWQLCGAYLYEGRGCANWKSCGYFGGVYFTTLSTWPLTLASRVALLPGSFYVRFAWLTPVGLYEVEHGKNRHVGVPGARKGGSVTVWGGCKCMCLGRLMCLKGDIALRMLRIGPVDVWDSISNVDNVQCTTDTECLSERAQVYHLLLLLLFL